jgi:nucleoside-diphosphate-sugar epimerase
VRKREQGADHESFIAGGSGALGKHLVAQLSAAGHEVVTMTRSPGKTAALRELGAQVAVADAFDREGVIRAVTRAEPEVVTQIRGIFNAKVQRELGWSPRYLTYREGFRCGLGDGHPSRKTVAT